MRVRTLLLIGAMLVPLAAEAQVTPGGVFFGTGLDASPVQPTIGNVLTAFPVIHPGQYFVQNQSGSPLQVIFDDGSGTAGTVSVQVLASGGVAGGQGADTNPPMPWFTGRIQVAGPPTSQFIARHN